MRKALLASLALTAALAAASPGAAQSAGLTLEIDRAQRLQLRAPAASVIVANPAVADVTVVEANILYVTGKAYGSTDLVVVDAIGRTLYQGVVNVTAAQSGQVRMWRGGQAVEMTCGSDCAPNIRQPLSSGSDGNP